METPNKKTNTNEAQNPALKLIFKQNPPAVSPSSLKELLIPYTKRKADHPKRGQLCAQKKTASSSKEMDGCKKIRKAEDTNPKNFEPWSPQAKEGYLARTDSAKKNSATTISNLTGSRREILSGRANDLNNVKKSPVNPLLIENSTRRTEEKNSIFEKPTLRYEVVPLIPHESIEINNNALLCANDGYQLNHNSSNVNSLSVVVRTPPQPNLDSLTKGVELEKQQTMGKPDEHLAPILLKEFLEDVEVIDVEEYNSFCGPSNFDPSVQEDVKPSKSVSDFGTFKILVHGIDITSKIKEKTRASYYNLCLDHNSRLHDHLMEGINLNDAVNYISQTVSVWNSIKSSSLSQTPEPEFRYWITVLESLLKFGMDVKFMLTRAKRLLDLKTKVKNTVDQKRDKAAKAEAEVLEEEIKAFELEIEKRREKKRRIDDERDGIRRKAEELETMFRKVATAPLN